MLADYAKRLEKFGADFILICTNTMHKVYAKVQNSVSINVIHIAKATLDELQKHNIKRVGLLGTKYTMCENFYKDVITSGDVDIALPDENDINLVNDVIFKELCIGNINKESTQAFKEIADKMFKDGADGIILGCTEVGLLLKQSMFDKPLFDTTLIHIDKAVELALS